jgi:hypothetical protein
MSYVSYYLKFSIKGSSASFAQLLKGNLSYSGPADLLQYYVKSYMIDDDIVTAQGQRGVQGLCFIIT